MYLFLPKKCNFTHVRVDQTRRRPLNLQAGLGFAPNGVNAFSSPQNFDSPFGLPQDDTLTLEMLCADLVCSEMTKSTVCRNEQTYADLVGAIHESPA